MVECYGYGKTDSSTRAHLKSYHESSISQAGGTVEGNDEFDLAKYLCLYFKGIFNMPHYLMTRDRQLYFRSEGIRAPIFANH
jgi:hypothetical protein